MIPKADKRLTKAALDKLRRQAAADPSFARMVADAGQPGLYAWARRGRIAFVFLYRPPSGGRRRRMRVDDYGAIALDQAREIARGWRGIVAAGRDPQEERTNRAREAATVADLIGLYLDDLRRRAESGAARGKRSGYTGARRLLERHVLPKLGTLRARNVTTDRIRRLHRSLKNTPSEANRMLAAFSAAFGFAEREEITPAKFNPCRHVTRFKETGKRRALTVDELRALGRALSEAEGASSAHPSVLLALRLFALTGLRRSELLGHMLLERRGRDDEALRWRDVDLERGFINLRNPKTGGAQSRVIGAAAVELLRAAKPEGAKPRDPVCPGKVTGRSFRGMDRPRARLYQAAREELRRSYNTDSELDPEDLQQKLDDAFEGVDLHSLRHTFASIGAHVQSGRFVGHVGPLLGHGYQARSVTERYISADPEALRPAADAIAGRIAGLLGLGEAGRVVSIEDGRAIHA